MDKIEPYIRFYWLMGGPIDLVRTLIDCKAPQPNGTWISNSYVIKTMDRLAVSSTKPFPVVKVLSLHETYEEYDVKD